MLSFQSLDVYKCSIELLALSHRTFPTSPRGFGALVDQLRRAAMSIPLNIAEASGRTSAGDVARAFSTARGSAMEVAAVIDVCEQADLIDSATGTRFRELLERIVAMLTKLCR